MNPIKFVKFLLGMGIMFSFMGEWATISVPYMLDCFMVIIGGYISFGAFMQ